MYVVNKTSAQRVCSVSFNSDVGELSFIVHYPKQRERKDYLGIVA